MAPYSSSSGDGPTSPAPLLAGAFPFLFCEDAGGVVFSSRELFEPKVLGCFLVK
eukprot:CAMPEP_0196643792 /NCGR_PEP_ID=MMETSP1085-20130531/6292_1 /TAXON_ID=41879 ORGANISM="Pycnococcus sp, Strain CCMP1998" /NCGR_SAMPLE_ID=MMETSP1085 /ASSEMBLY_ACC=CAM_ASM_000807 /LENGTH=53 /DNA_ID=CAMNT_0041973291 /DNA_START=38 /DNA_END=199 /DNA_ORIENTATION=-